MEDLERSMMDDETFRMFEDFRKQHTLQSVLSELNILRNDNQIIRLMSTENIICNKCKKKAIYAKYSDNTYLCWKHGYELAKC